jgi:hypothetical protein
VLLDALRILWEEMKGPQRPFTKANAEHGDGYSVLEALLGFSTASGLAYLLRRDIARRAAGLQRRLPLDVAVQNLATSRNEHFRNLAEALLSHRTLAYAAGAAAAWLTFKLMKLGITGLVSDKLMC